MSDRPSEFTRRTVALARGQHGIVDRRGLTRLGINPGTVDSRVRRGHLEPVFAGSYKLAGSPLTLNGLRMACVRAAGDGAVLGLKSAAAVWGFLPASVSIEVLKTSRIRNARALVPVAGYVEWPYLLARRVKCLAPEDVSEVDGLPLTTVEVTLRGLAGVMPKTRYEETFDEADRLGLIDESRLSKVAAGCQGFRGASGFLEQVHGRIEDVGEARSRLEVLTLKLLRDGRLPSPAVNVMVAGHLVDFCWCDRKVIVETDGYAFHRGRAAFERDRLRDNELRALGWNVLRFTYRQVTRRPEYVQDLIRMALVGPPSSGPFEVVSPRLRR